MPDRALLELALACITQFPIVGGLILSGCAGTVSHERNLSPGLPGLPLAGLYDLTLHTVDMGSVTGRIAAEVTESCGFRANSRPGVVSKLVGGFKGFIAPLIASKEFGGGAFLHWEALDGRRPGHGEIRLPLGSFLVDLPSWDGPAELRAADGTLVGFVTLRTADPAMKVSADRQALVQQIEQTFRERVYDPALMDAPGVRSYLARLQELSKLTRDDMEFLFAAHLARKLLPFSHVSLTRKLDSPFAERLKDSKTSGSPDLQVTWQGTVATIRARGFWQAEEAIDRVFEEVRSQKATAAIVDIRGCRGGDYSSMRVAAHLLSRPADSGVLFGPAARNEVLAGKLDRFPEVTRLRSVEELTTMVRAQGAIRGRVQPVAEPFTGAVAVLVNGGTASAAEPLAAVLQSTGRARLFGGRTAGAMLSSERVELGEGWILQLPVFDYVTAAGVRLEGRGVTPDVPCDPKDAPQLALDFVRFQR